MKLKKIITSMLAVSLVLSSALPSVFAEESAAATRGEVVQMLLTAVDDYNPTVQKTDIIEGYEDGQLHEERFVTRAEALVMLKRAFGELPIPTGHNARVALKAENFTDIPDWAVSELESVFDTGIVAGTAEGIFSPDELVTHAFDNIGAKFDADGNATDWWAEEDYAAFNERCEALSEFYDGQEAVPGVPMDGTLTLSENVSDNGAVSCITEIVSGLENPDFKTLYESIARSWISTTTRDGSTYLSQTDVHCADKLRVNRVIVNCPEFYEAFGITEKDGMYVAPEDRVKVW